MRQTGSIILSSSKQREERKTIQEECIFCEVDNLIPSKGMILNESASGILLKSDVPLRPNLRVYVLPIQIGELRYANASSLVILNHPLTRSGKVVRIEENGNAGIKFDPPKPNQANFKRWYRDDATITTVIDQTRAIIKIQGKISIEAGSLVNSIINKTTQELDDLLISASNANYIHSTASTVIRSTIKNVLDKNKQLTFISGPNGSPSSMLLSGLSTEQYSNLYVYQMNTQHLSILENKKAKSNEQKVDIDRLVDALVISHSYTALERYCHPLINIKFKIEKCKGISNSKKLILETSPQFIIIDFELKNSEQLLLLNKINTQSLYRTPCLILIGPQYIEQLVRAALKLKVSEYLYRPCNNDEYLTALQKSIKRLPLEFMEKHLKKLRENES